MTKTKGIGPGGAAMKFTVKINTADGGKRTAEFASQYDATAVLVGQVERDVLAPGETIAERPSAHDRKPVPAIERVA